MDLFKKVIAAQNGKCCSHFNGRSFWLILGFNLLYMLITLHWPHDANAITKMSFQVNAPVRVAPRNISDQAPLPDDKAPSLYDQTPPPYTVIRSLYAYVDNGRVIVEWETVSEDNIIGFNLTRLDPKNGKHRRINRRLLPGLLVSPEGGTYRYEDKTAQPGNTYTYKVIAREAKGGRQVYGPFTIVVDDPGFEPRLAQDEAYNSIDVDGDTLDRKAKKRRQRVVRKQYRKRKSVQRKGKTGVYISLKNKGIYQVAAEDIGQAMGLSGDNIRRLIKRKKLALTYQGQPVAWQPLARGKALIFYGENIDSTYTDLNVYRLDLGRSKTISSIKGEGPVALSMPDGFSTVVHAEKDQWALTGIFDDPNEDYWAWDYLMSVNESFAQKDFVVSIPGRVANTPATLTIHLKGGSTATHGVTIAVNGTPVAKTAFQGTISHSQTCTIPADVFTTGENTVTLTVGKPSIGSSIVYVDSFDLSYEKAFTAIKDQLFFRAEDHPVVTVDGFGNGNIKVYDVTDPANIIRIKAVTIDETQDGTYRVSLRADNAKKRYLAVADNAVIALSGKNMAGYLAPHLLNTDHSVDYLVIAPEELKDEAQRLADYRQSQGLSTMVILLQDIYDEFNYGIANPEAVRDFLEYAWYNWSKPPRYVARVGDGSHDYKDIQGTGDTLMPPLMVNTPWGLSASENRLADVDGSDDGVPEMMIGLLPAENSEALAAMIDKIIAYESSSGDWKNKVLMVADNPDGSGNFPADSDAVAALVSGDYTKESIHLGNLDLATARKTLSSGFEAGAFLMNYFGHAGMDRLATEGLWTLSNVGAMTNHDLLPIVVGMTCVAGRFEIPGYDAIGEAMVVKHDGGAVAAWVPTGMSLNYLARILDEEFFKAVFTDKQTVLGDAILTAMRAFKARHPIGHSFMLDIYTLIGDPALVIK